MFSCSTQHCKSVQLTPRPAVPAPPLLNVRASVRATSYGACGATALRVHNQSESAS
jgi:hypothetical protein